MRYTKPLFICLFFGTVVAWGQLEVSLTRKIDSLFVDWTVADHPGGAIAIMQGGETTYSKAFGLASLEYQVPNQPETQFNIASVSKQFTAMAMVVLEERGLLSIDEDIRTYLTDLPDFGHPITIRQMLHHTSGLRSLHALLSLAGWRDDDSRTNADLYRFMLRQQDLNFIPGDEYLYCNTGYMLMAEIVERITKKKFPEWMANEIFAPLGMDHSYVEDRYDRVVPNNATSYYDTRDGFFRAVEYWGYVGSGNMHSTTADLLKWMRNFSAPEAGWESAFERLKTVDPLNDGSNNTYAFGIFVDDYLGHPRIRHGSSIGGLRAMAVTFPDAALSIVILTNFSSSGSGKLSRDIAQLLLDPKPGAETSSPQTPASSRLYEEPKVSVDLSGVDLKQFAGRFHSPELESTIDILFQDGKLLCHHARHGDFPVFLIDEDVLEMLSYMTMKVIRDSEGSISGLCISNGRARNVWFKKQG